MIVVRLKGGLGNQMFQYAAARRLSLKCGVELKLDTTAFGGVDFRSYSLSPFAIQAAIADKEDIARFRSNGLVQKIGRRLSGRTVVLEKSFVFDASLLDLGDDCYLEGYWQSELYFADRASDIRAELQPLESKEFEREPMMESIRKDPSVSVHVRRGDYVSNPEALRVHGLCDLAYYNSAAETIRSYVPDAVFHVFTDDPAWVEESFRPSFPFRLFKGNGRDEFDMFAMSQCKHNIVANSSFSWWAAWLNAFPQKKIVAPAQWFRDTSVDTSTLIPSSWTRV